MMSLSRFGRYAVALGLVGMQHTAWGAGRELPTLLQLVSPPVVVGSLYKSPLRMLSGVGRVAPNGAVGDNAKGLPTIVNVESQRWGADLVQAALLNRTSPQPGIDIMLYGFAREQADGSFGEENGFQHVSFFLEAAARTLLLLKQSGNPAYSDLIARTTPKLELAAQRFVSSGQAKEQEDKGSVFTHRFYLLAAALGETAVLTKDKQLGAAAERYLRLGLASQLPDGTNPEKLGFDINYGAASGTFAIRYYAICTDPELRRQIEGMLRKALAREALAISPDGEVSIADSTRTGKDARHDDSGKPKGIDHKSIIPFFAIGAAITGEPRYSEIAQQIATKRGW